MDEMCPSCGSLDVFEDILESGMLICNDCGHKFPVKDVNNSEQEEKPEEWNEERIEDTTEESWEDKEDDEDIDFLSEDSEFMG